MITFLIIAIISFIFLSCVFKNDTYLTNGAFSSVIACVITIIVNVAFFATTRHTMGEYVENKTYKIAECDIMSSSDIIKTDNNLAYSQKELSENTSFILSSDSLSYLDVRYVNYGKESCTNKWILYTVFPYKHISYTVRLNERDYNDLKPFIDKVNMLNRKDY